MLRILILATIILSSCANAKYVPSKNEYVGEPDQVQCDCKMDKLKAAYGKKVPVVLSDILSVQLFEILDFCASEGYTGEFNPAKPIKPVEDFCSGCADDDATKMFFMDADDFARAMELLQICDGISSVPKKDA